MFFRITSQFLQDGRAVMAAELTALVPSPNYLAHISYEEKRVSPEPIKSQAELAAFGKDFNLRLYGGEVEVQKDGKPEKIPIRGIIPTIQSDYPSCEITNGWVGW
jgi:hypothetical protein